MGNHDSQGKLPVKVWLREGGLAAVYLVLFAWVLNSYYESFSEQPVMAVGVVIATTALYIGAYSLALRDQRFRFLYKVVVYLPLVGIAGSYLYRLPQSLERIVMGVMVTAYAYLLLMQIAQLIMQYREGNAVYSVICDFVDAIQTENKTKLAACITPWFDGTDMRLNTTMPIEGLHLIKRKPNAINTRYRYLPGAGNVSKVIPYSCRTVAEWHFMYSDGRVRMRLMLHKINGQWRIGSLAFGIW